MPRVKINKDGTIKLSEHDEQVALFQWKDAIAREYPDLCMMYAIPNGAFYGNNMIRIRGKEVPARIIQANRMRAEGLQPGMLDICLPVARDGYHGFYWEMKVKPNKPSEEQEWWMEQLAKQGYKVGWGYGQDEAKKAICEYMSIPNREFI